MKYVDEYRDGHVARTLGVTIAQTVQPNRDYRFMEFCGGHTHAISRYGIEDLLPANVRMIHGPGCPVCVLPIGRIDAAIRLSRRSEITLCTYGDVMRIPGSRGTSLFKARAAGADVRMVYSTLDAIRIAESEPGREVVFFAVGFETTTPPTALAIRAAVRKKLLNFSVFCNHVLTPPAILAVLKSANTAEFGGLEVDGFIGPSHVSTVIGTDPFAPFADAYEKPVVVAGFEPLDVMQAILMLVRQINDGRHEVENQYTRAVTRDGNGKAQAEMADVFDLRESFEWRGLGLVPKSGLRLKEVYSLYDAERRFDVQDVLGRDNPACECGAILRGVKKPIDCKLFGTVCTPDNPMGSCMVSSEGACAAHWTYGRFRDFGRRVS